MSGYTILGAAAASREDTPPVRRSEPQSPVTTKTDEEARAAAIAYLHSIVGLPYVWASKDPSVGLDCSGAVTVAYEKAGLARPGARYRYGSADLHRTLRQTSDPRPGDLAFYGSPVTHVMMVTDKNRVIGATGGGRKTKTTDDAREIGAYVKYKPVDYRKDLVAYGEAPSVLAPLGGSTSKRLSTSDSREDLLMSIGRAIVGAAGLALGTWAIWKIRQGYSR